MDTAAKPAVMAEHEAQDSEDLQKDVKEEEAQDIESQINAAMRSRVAHFKEQAEYARPLSIKFFV